jgi:hypothetical protein
MNSYAYEIIVKTKSLLASNRPFLKNTVVFETKKATGLTYQTNELAANEFVNTIAESIKVSVENVVNTRVIVKPYKPKAIAK